MPTTPLSASSPIESYLHQLHAKYSTLRDGKVADYIPELAKANPDWFGICLVTRDGHIYEVGDSRQHFTIQSVSKALSYGLALEDRGESHVLSRISVEPSGDAFNAISLKPGSGAPFNPMINAGAIATCGQILKQDGQSRIDRILAYLSGCAGRRLDIDQNVYRSESETGHRNRAIGWMLRNFDIIDEEPTDILETYFQQCAIRVTCRDLAVMAATLANYGRNPLTREQAINPNHVEKVLSVMSSCGMYDFSGEWIYRVGLPAKSGVGGGIMAVLPGQIGIGLFSPLLDAQGNSQRGIEACTDLSKNLSLHLFAGGATQQNSIRLSYDGSQVTSCRRRIKQQQNTLRTNGHRTRVLELQGSLIFSTFEPVVRKALKQAPYCQFMVINFRDVISMDDVATRLVAELQQSLIAQGVILVVCDANKYLARLGRAGLPLSCHFDSTDAALEFCENQLLQDILGETWDESPPVALGDTVLLSGLDEIKIAWLDAAMSRHTDSAGSLLIRTGENGDGVFILLSGSVEVRLPTESNGSGKRLDVFTAGMSFGEMAYLDNLPRSADVVALEDVSYRIIDRELFSRLETERPDILVKLLEQMARMLSGNLRRSNAEANAYKGSGNNALEKNAR